MKTTVIGIGRVGLCWAQELVTSASQFSICDPQPSAAAMRWSAQSRIATQPEIAAWVADQDFVAISVPGSDLPAGTGALKLQLKSEATIIDVARTALRDKRTASTAADTAFLTSGESNRIGSPADTTLEAAWNWLDLLRRKAATVAVAEGVAA